jgi:hypothetical protein
MCLWRCRPDSTLDTFGRSGLNFAVAERISGIHLPSEQGGVESRRLIRCLRHDLKLQDWIRHFSSLLALARRSGRAPCTFSDSRKRHPPEGTLCELREAGLVPPPARGSCLDQPKSQQRGPGQIYPVHAHASTFCNPPAVGAKVRVPQQFQNLPVDALGQHCRGIGRPVEQSFLTIRRCCIRHSLNRQIQGHLFGVQAEFSRPASKLASRYGPGFAKYLRQRRMVGAKKRRKGAQGVARVAVATRFKLPAQPFAEWKLGHGADGTGTAVGRQCPSRQTGATPCPA